MRESWDVFYIRIDLHEIQKYVDYSCFKSSDCASVSIPRDMWVSAREGREREREREREWITEEEGRKSGES